MARKRKFSCVALLAAVAVLMAGAVAAQTPINDAQQQWQQLQTQVMEAYQAGEYAKGVASAEQALQLARQAFGPRHPDTLTSLNNLAALYDKQGRLAEAEPLYREALQRRREMLGPRHLDTLTSLNNLAALYDKQGRLAEAEPLYREWLEGRRLGPRTYGGSTYGDYVGAGSYYRLRIVTASRVFAGLTQYPPEEFAAYGILAFRSRPSPYDRERHLMFCNAYVATLPHASELELPPSGQMVTVWPVSSDDASDLLNRQIRKHGEVICPIAVDNYGLVMAQQALKDAELTGRTLNRAGPFLLAWSPSADKGKQDALVLVSDLSDITTYEQAHERFLAWSHDIESDSALWMSGWNLERLRTYTRTWVDKYGEMALALFAR